MEPAVKIHQLTKVFRLPGLKRQRVAAVRDLSLEVSPGEIYGLIGPNGSGKSTTMKVLLGLIAPTRGSTAIFGQDSRSVRSRVAVGFLPENPYFYKFLTGEETLHFYGRLGGLPRKEIRRRSGELLAMVELEHARDRRLSGYSKGMLQRIGLAQALIQRPRLLVLDEPTAGVDPAGSRKIRDLILKLREDGITVVLSSHLLEQVQEVCDRVGIIFQGKLCREGPMEELMAIEEQTEILLDHAPRELIEKVKVLVQEHEGTSLLRVGHPRTTLERLFLEETSGQSPDTGD